MALVLIAAGRFILVSVSRGKGEDLPITHLKCLASFHLKILAAEEFCRWVQQRTENGKPLKTVNNPLTGINLFLSLLSVWVVEGLRVQQRWCWVSVMLYIFIIFVTFIAGPLPPSITFTKIRNWDTGMIALKLETEREKETETESIWKSPHHSHQKHLHKIQGPFCFN